ncbi:PepSY domain-containing protein [Ciceribacter azotifigens]|uniref:PepSY domain-containing protein n=1 Tax=Ciceribacter azotifigens TaxID=2069303 RepID=UPI003A85B52E
MKYHALAAALFCVGLGGVALADDDCDVPMADWQPRNVIQKMAEERGWTVRKIRTDDGCYQIFATDASGRQIEVKVNPSTMEIVEMEDESFRDHKRESHHGDHEDEDDDHDGRRSTAASEAVPTPITATPPANGLFKNGARPKVTIQ